MVGFPAVIALALFLFSPPQPQASPHGTADAIAEAMHRELLIPASVEAGRPRAWSYCQRAPKGCRERLHAFARAFVLAGDANGVDPWLLASQAMKESRANPGAEGKGGERGVLQIHPKRREVREDGFLRAWFFDDRFRKNCLAVRPDACQGPIIWLAAEIMGRAQRMCEGSEDAEACGLSYYNTGRPDRGLRYAAAVRRWRVRLKGGQ